MTTAERIRAIQAEAHRNNNVERVNYCQAALTGDLQAYSALSRELQQEQRAQ